MPALNPAVAQLKVKSDPVSIRTAAEQFLTKRPEQREGLIRLVMEGHLRGIIGQLTVEQIVKEPEMVGDRMRSTCAADMNKMGLDVVSFTLKEVRDKNEYITNMGRPDIARIKRDAEVAAAEADRVRSTQHRYRTGPYADLQHSNSSSLPPGLLDAIADEAVKRPWNWHSKRSGERRYT